MPFDGLTLGFMGRELQETLRDGRIEKVTQPEKDMLVLLIRAQGKNHRLLLSAAPSFARAHITRIAYQNPLEAPMFCMLMRKHLQGGHLLGIEQVGGDRVLKITLENKDELGDSAPRELYLELMGRHSNLTLVKDGKIVDAIRHVSGDMSRVRQALPGLPFVPPPAQDKIDPAELTEEALLEKLTVLAGPLDKALAAGSKMGHAICRCVTAVLSIVLLSRRNAAGNSVPADSAGSLTALGLLPAARFVQEGPALPPHTQKRIAVQNSPIKLQFSPECHSRSSPALFC